MKEVDELLAEMFYTFLVSDMGAAEERREEFVIGLLNTNDFTFRIGEAFSSELWFKMDPDSGPRVELTDPAPMSYNTYWYKTKTSTEVLQSLYERLKEPL